jgi:hypothetical protein
MNAAIRGNTRQIGLMINNVSFVLTVLSPGSRRQPETSANPRNKQRGDSDLAVWKLVKNGSGHLLETFHQHQVQAGAVQL